MEKVIREVLAEHGRLNVDAHALGDDDDLYRHGLTSHASVNVMLALEDNFDVEFPDQLLRKRTFGSISSIREALLFLGCSA
ncbi:MAG TPA: acyl carrier protein, partial [Acidimicrobiales bacterium]|nr:acyl carrier protein [Acidimicrobiales bacterium]